MYWTVQNKWSQQLAKNEPKTFGGLPFLILDNRPAKRLINCMNRFCLDIVDFIVLDVCSRPRSCQKICSEKQKLLQVVVILNKN